MTNHINYRAIVADLFGDIVQNEFELKRICKTANLDSNKVKNLLMDEAEWVRFVRAAAEVIDIRPADLSNAQIVIEEDGQEFLITDTGIWKAQQEPV